MVTTTPAKVERRVRLLPAGIHLRVEIGSARLGCARHGRARRGVARGPLVRSDDGLRPSSTLGIGIQLRLERRRCSARHAMAWSGAARQGNQWFSRRWSSGGFDSHLPTSARVSGILVRLVMEWRGATRFGVVRLGTTRVRLFLLSRFHMLHKQINFQIKGITPLMLNNGRKADPLNPLVKRMKAITSKKKKTDEDHQAILALDWEAGLYLDDNGRVVIPGENIEAAFVEAGKKQKNYDRYKAGLLSDGLWVLDYEGPKNVDKLKADMRFRDVRGVSVNRKRVMRCRPIFRNWSLSFSIHYLPDLLNETEIRDDLATIGRIIGLCDYTPKYGRFDVVDLKEKK